MWTAATLTSKLWVNLILWSASQNSTPTKTQFTLCFSSCLVISSIASFLSSSLFPSERKLQNNIVLQMTLVLTNTNSIYSTLHLLGPKSKMSGLYLDYIKTKNVLIKFTYILYISMKKKKKKKKICQAKFGPWAMVWSFLLRDELLELYCSSPTHLRIQVPMLHLIRITIRGDQMGPMILNCIIM